MSGPPAGGDTEAVSPQVVRYSERPRSMRITGTVGEWESWTGMQFPGTGDYVFPAGLATVHIDRDRDRGEYWEPNVWIIHPPVGGTPR
jgi:hypothetical protein